MENPQNEDGGRRESADQLQAALEAVDPENHEIQQQQQPARRCPRCNSANTKFCYYNNYSQSQPRYFCKGCRRYWTHGGSLRNVPVGGSSRKYKRPRPPPTPPSTSAQLPAPGQMIVPSTQAPPLLPSSLPAPCYFPTSFHSGGGGGGAGFFSSLVALQSMNHTPGGTLSSNLGNPLHGFEFGNNLFNKPCVSAGLLPPVTGAAALNSSSAGGGFAPQGAGDISVLKPDQWTDNLGGAGGDRDN